MAFIRLVGMEYVGCEPAPRGEVLIVADKHQGNCWQYFGAGSVGTSNLTDSAVRVVVSCKLLIKDKSLVREHSCFYHVDSGLHLTLSGVKSQT